ncbi:MAG: hypothetical protein ABIM40_05305, partial [Pseudomonadota bacterium]
MNREKGKGHVHPWGLMQKRGLAMLGLALVLTVGPWFFQRLAHAEVPINPLSPEIRQQIRKTVEVVATVEDGMAPLVQDVATLMESYQACQGNELDRGCVQIKDQLSAKYKAVVDKLGEAIPKVQGQLKPTAEKLGMSIDSQTQRAEVKQLYESIRPKKSLTDLPARGPLSKKLSALLGAFGAGSGTSPLEASLRTQADLASAADILDLLDARVGHLQLMIELGQDIPIMNEDMLAVMGGA